MNEDGSRARGIVAVIAVAALALLCGVLILRPPPEGSREVLFLVVGALIAFCTDVKQFYFGSSSGSKALAAAQTELLKTTVATTGTGNGLTAAAPTGTAADPVSVTPVEPREAFDAAPPPPAVDPRFVRFRAQVFVMNPDATEDDIRKSFALIYPDVALP